MRATLAALIVASATLVALPAAAQQGVVPQAPQPQQPGGVQIQSPEPPARPARVVPPPLHYETSEPPDNHLYREGTKVEHDPAFIEPLAGSYETPTGSGRFGLSGWTAPVAPLGSRQIWQDSSGWFALGFSITWDGPPAQQKTRPRPTAPARQQ
jgi:hypothetical protein